jgi:hypothetical protein
MLESLAMVIGEIFRTIFSRKKRMEGRQRRRGMGYFEARDRYFVLEKTHAMRPLAGERTVRNQTKSMHGAFDEVSGEPGEGLTNAEYGRESPDAAVADRESAIARERERRAARGTRSTP